MGKGIKDKHSVLFNILGRWGNEQERSYLNRKPKPMLAIAKASAKRKTQLWSQENHVWVMMGQEQVCFSPSLNRWWLKDKSCLESNQVIGLKFSWVFRDCLGHNGKLIENLHLWDLWTLQLLIKYYCKVHKGSLWERFLSTSAFISQVCGKMVFIFSTSSPKKSVFMIVIQLLLMMQ